MEIVGRVESLWRYPVKSMKGELLHQAFVGFAGVYGDRCFAFTSAAAPKGFPYFTGREKETMLLYQPAYCNAGDMQAPLNYAEAEALAPGLTTVYPNAEDIDVEVRTPSGDSFSINDPLLIRHLRERISDRHQLSLLRSHRALTDCRPLSLFSLQTARTLGEELQMTMDKRRFRANVYLDLTSQKAFQEDSFVGRTLQIGTTTVVAIVGRDARCKMITLDPDTAEATPEIMRHLARAHEGKAGVYAAVLAEGIICPGDEVGIVS